MSLKVSRDRDYRSDISWHLCSFKCILPLILVHLRHMLVSDPFFENYRKRYRRLLSASVDKYVQKPLDKLGEILYLIVRVRVIKCTRSSVDRATDCGSVGRRFNPSRVRPSSSAYLAWRLFCLLCFFLQR